MINFNGNLLRAISTKSSDSRVIACFYAFFGIRSELILRICLIESTFDSPGVILGIEFLKVIENNGQDDRI